MNFRNEQASAVGVMSMDCNSDRSSLTPKEKHALGVKLYENGQFRDALTILEEALGETETVPADYWNDWGAVAFACGQIAQAEQGFVQALRLDPSSLEAAANLGALLAKLGRSRDALPFLEKAAQSANGEHQGALDQLLATCRLQAAADTLNEARVVCEKFVARLQTTPAPQPVPVLRPPVYMGNNRALLCTRDHSKMYVDTTDLLIAPWLLMHGEWEPEETELFKRLLKPGALFVDVGANIGYYTLLAVRLGASQVYAFEPQAATYELLSKNVIINWMTKVVRCENLAAFSHTTELDFFARKAYPGNSSIGVSPPEQLREWFDTTEKVTLRAVSLDDYFSDKPGKIDESSDKRCKIDLMKVDVEGAEPAAFEGARRILSQNRDIKVLCEWSPDQMATAKQDPERLVHLWGQLGFRAFVLHTGLGEVSLKSLLKSGYQNLLLHR